MTNNEIVARFYYRFYHHDDKQNEEFEKNTYSSRYWLYLR